MLGWQNKKGKLILNWKVHAWEGIWEGKKGKCVVRIENQKSNLLKIKNIIFHKYSIFMKNPNNINGQDFRNCDQLFQHH